MRLAVRGEPATRLSGVSRAVGYFGKRSTRRDFGLHRNDSQSLKLVISHSCHTGR